MKSKIITNSKRKTIAFIVTTIAVVLMLIVGIMANYKESELTIRKLATNKMSATSVTGKDLATAENETKYYNTNINIYPQTGDDNIRYVELQRRNSEGKWETYTNEKNNLTYKYMLGDVDNNGKINEYDAALIWGYLAGENDLTALQKIVADINGDGLINNVDYQIILYSAARYKTNNGEAHPYYIGNPLVELNPSSDDNIMEGFNIEVNDARAVLRLSLGLGIDVFNRDIGNENRTEEEKSRILVAKMISDYNFDGKISADDVQLYLNAAVNLPADNEILEEMKSLADANDINLNINDLNLESAREAISKSVQPSINLYKQVKDINYYTNNYIKFNTGNVFFPELEDDGEYKLITYKITTDAVKLTDVGKMLENSKYNECTEYYFTIDKTAPNCEVEYVPNSNQPTNQNVTAIITFDEDVKTSTAKEYNKIYKIEFDKNGKEDITYFDKAGNSKIVDLHVTWIDKEKPTLINCVANQNENLITVEATFSEKIGKDNTTLQISFGGIEGKGKYTKTFSEDSTKIVYQYDISEADGGEAQIVLNGTVTDLAENESEQLNEIIANNISLKRTAIDNGDGYIYKFELNDKAIEDLSKPTYCVKGDQIKVIKISKKTLEETKYSYILEEKIDFSHMKYMKLIDKKDENESNRAEFYTTDKEKKNIDITQANIYFDTVAPTVAIKVGVDVANENNVYTKGTNLNISAVASEIIPNAEETIPQINVLFSNSGLGKDNFQTDSKKGNARLVDITVEDGKTVWKYIYTIQNGDDGDVIIDYASDIEIRDIVGNKSLLAATPKEITDGEVKLDQTIDEINTVSYEIYKNDKQLTDFKKATYFEDGDKIKVIVKFKNALYNGDTGKLINKNEAPILYIETSANEKINMSAQQVNESGNTITYEYTIKDLKNSKLMNMYMYSNVTMWPNVAKWPDTDKSLHNPIGPGNIAPIDINNCNLFIYNSNTEIDTGKIKTDTTAPTVKISAKNVDTNEIIENGLTNASEIEYSFKWSEEVFGFTIEDLTIINGTPKELIQDENDKTLYTLVVKNDIADGSNGTIKVIVNRDAVKDIVGHSNERFENEIRVDRQAAILIGLEAYAESEIKVNSEVDSVKRYYKAGEKVTIIATFNENINLVDDKVPDLALKFAESGNAKNNVELQEKIDGNKIVYTYVLADNDNGELSVKGFTGNVVDAAGNKTVVTKRALDGDTIIADTISPNLKELKIISPASGIYKAETVVAVEAIFDEEVYVLENNEIKNVTEKTAPIVNIKIGASEEISLSFSEYGTNNGKIDKTKLVYTYKIRGEEKDEQGKLTYNGDNGIVSIVKIENVQNAQVCDIAGNIATLTVNQTGNEINVDTIRPYVDSITATVENPLILGTDPYYKAGNDIKITLAFSEKVNSAKIQPKILVGFSENADQKPQSYSEYSYESDWNVNSTTVEYTYTIKDGDNGYLWVEVPEGQFADAAGNSNTAKDAQIIKNIYADTTAPYVAVNTDGTAKWNIEYIKNKDGQITGIKAEGMFNEIIYSMSGNTLTDLTHIPVMGIFINGNLEDTAENPKVEQENGQTKLTYEKDITKIDKTGNISVNLISGTVYDRAGNIWSIDLGDGDTTSPIFKDIKVVTPIGFYNKGKVIEIVARFEEQTKLTNVPKLKIRLGDTVKELDGSYDKYDIENTENIKVARYSYTIVDENGALNIISLIGKVSDGLRERDIKQIYIDENKDEINGKANELLNSIETNYANSSDENSNVIADTIRPYVTSIVAMVGDNEIATYTKEEGKDAVITVGRTNANSIKYIVTMSEDIFLSDVDKILVTNGNVINVKRTDKNIFTIDVQATTEGVQSLILQDGVAEDRAGNLNEFARLDGVTIDFTCPLVRFISEYNGGEYVIPTNIGKIEIRPNIEINEEISKVEYKWDEEEFTEVKNYSSSSDIAIPSKTFEETGKYTLYIKATDLAGNQTITNKVYIVYYSSISFDYNDEYTNKDLEVKVEFGKGLTDNRKVLFKANNSKDIVQLNAIGTDGDKIKYSIPENGILYAEATDKVGNKVFNQTTITNIDKESPIVKLETNGGNLVIGTGKDKATIKSIINVEDENLSSIEYAITNINTSVENVTPENIKENAGLSFTTIENYSEAKIENAVEGTYYIYVIAKDKAENTTIYKSEAFTVANSNELKGENGEVIYAPAAENTIKFTREKSIVYVDFGYNLSENQRITLTNDEDGIVYDNNAEIFKSTVVTATAEDICGNSVKMTYTVENVEGPKFEVQGDLEHWTNEDIELNVISYDNLSALTVNGEDILKNKMKVTIKENGDYTFKATDIYGNSTEKIIKVSNIDKVKPVISKVEVNGNDITITANDELSGLSEYAVTKTTEVPVEWSSSNTISTTKDGTFYVWAKDKAGNITIGENTAVVDTTAPTITFEYMSLTVTVGMPIEANIKTNELAKISYSWDNKTWIDSNEFNTSIKVSEKSTKPGKYTLYAKAIDTANNASEVTKVEFSVENIEDIRQPEIIFEDLAIIQINGVKYVKISPNTTKELLTDKMNKTALCGVTPEYKNLTEDGKLKTGTEILLNGETKYIIAVKGDVNGDGKVTFLEDVVMANNYRIGIISLSTVQKLASDINNNSTIDFIQDIVAINNYRLGIIKEL